MASLLRTCLPDDFLESNPSEEKDQIVMKEDKECFHEELTMVTQTNEQTTEPVMTQDREKTIYETDKERKDNERCLDDDIHEGRTQQEEENIDKDLLNDKNQPKHDMKSTRKNRKRKVTHDMQEEITDANNLTTVKGRKRKRKASETDDVFNYSDEETQDIKIQKNKQTIKSKKNIKNTQQHKKRPAVVKKKARITSKAALKGKNKFGKRLHHATPPEKC